MLIPSRSPYLCINHLLPNSPCRKPHLTSFGRTPPPKASSTGRGDSSCPLPGFIRSLPLPLEMCIISWTTASHSQLLQLQTRPSPGLWLFFFFLAHFHTQAKQGTNSSSLQSTCSTLLKLKIDTSGQRQNWVSEPSFINKTG